MNKLEVWEDFFNYLLEEVFDPIEETEETKKVGDGVIGRAGERNGIEDCDRL